MLRLIGSSNGGDRTLISVVLAFGFTNLRVSLKGKFIEDNGHFKASDWLVNSYMFNRQMFQTAFACAIATTIGISIPKASQAADFTPSNVTPSASNELQLAQAIVPNARTLSVTGNGIGRVPADQAAIIFSYGLNYYLDPLATATPGSTPTPPPPAQPSDLKAVTDALAGAGISAGDITITREPYSAQSLRMVIKVNNPTRERISTLVDLAQNTTIKDNKFLASISGVIYAARNCQAAETTARQAAMDSARSQAESLAATAGVSLGDLFNISGNPSWSYAGPYPTSTCSANLDDSLQLLSSYGAQPYDSSLPPEVTASMSISLSYELK